MYSNCVKRREFVLNSASASALLNLPFSNVFSRSSKIKVGILRQLFQASGYDTFNYSESITHYLNTKKAYLDLRENRIDALITSPVLHQKNFRSDYNLKSEVVGSFSPLKIRISNLSFEELALWRNRGKSVSVAATGCDAFSFEQMGFYVRQDTSLLKLTMQLVDMSRNHLNLTNSYPPALFLNAFGQNKKVGVSPCAAPLHNLVLADDSSSSAVVELVYRSGSSSHEIANLRDSLRSSLQHDDVFQETALKILLEKPNFSFSHKFPDALGETIAAYKEISNNLKYPRGLS